MKYDDIEKFPHASYAVDVPFRSVVDWVRENENDLGLEMNPDFQRGHVWTEEQQIAYVEYIIRGGRDGRDIYFNHPGWQSSYKGEMVCMDGLQRVTAVIRFTNDEIRAFGALASEFDVLPAMSVTLRFNVFRLATRKEVLKWYIQFNSAGVIHSDEELNRVRDLMEAESD